MNFFEKEMRMMFEHTGIIQDLKFVGRTMVGILDDKGTRKVHYTNKEIIEENILDAFPSVYSPPVRPSRRAATGGQALSLSDEPLFREPEHQVRTD